VETHGHLDAILDTLGKQLVGKAYAVARFADQEQATLPIERALAEQSTLLILDNLESILPPPYLQTERPAALDEDASRELAAILKLCKWLNGKGNTRLIYTSREALPAPFANQANRRELHRLATEDAVRLIERILDRAVDNGADAGSAAELAEREEIERLVDAVQSHAQTLALLAPSLREQGVVDKTRTHLVALMAELERRFPGNREQSLFAGVELSLRRLSPESRERVRVLGVFHGGASLTVLGLMMEWQIADVTTLAEELVQTGLGTMIEYGHIPLNSALCPYLHQRLDPEEQAALTECWRQAMQAYVAFLVQQRSEKTELAATLTLLELPNLFALLEQIQTAGDPAVTIELATHLYSLLQTLGKPRLLDYVGQVRDAAAAALGADWNHAAFQAQRTRIEQQLAGGQLQETLADAQKLLQCARAAGVEVYAEADYNLAMAYDLLAQVLGKTGSPDAALPLLDGA